MEPLPEVYAALCRNRTCRALNCCVGDRQGRAEFLAIDGYSEMLSGLLETYDPRHLERVERECGQHGCNRKVIEVDCVPPGALFEDPRFRRVDYLSLDVEGCEERVLKAIPFDRTHISIITVENNFGDDGILRHLASHGFALLGKLPHDDIFIKGD